VSVIDYSKHANKIQNVKPVGFTGCNGVSQPTVPWVKSKGKKSELL